jgi:2,3-diaminopropionate biosynthesis protein SbnA
MTTGAGLEDGSQCGCVGNTPMRTISLLVGGVWRRVSLKLEGCNPAGSSKDRTAQALIANLKRRGLLKHSSIVVESTSGNLGVSLAYQCGKLGYQFLAVIDPKTSPEIRNRIHSLGARLEIVQEQDENGGYLLSRLKRVRELCAQSSAYLWTDQYSNPANPAAHFRSTAPEIFTQTDRRVDAIFVAVSTGGTIVGIDRYFRRVSPATAIIAVDAVGSVVFGGRPGIRKLTGIGSSRPSDFIKPGRSYVYRQVADRDAFAVCRQVDRDIKLRLGGSSGAVIFACAQTLAENPQMKHVVCLCADGGDNYVSTIYTDGWLESNDFDPAYRVSAIEAVEPVRPFTTLIRSCEECTQNIR